MSNPPNPTDPQGATPRTDETSFVWTVVTPKDGRQMVSADFARQLERELGTASAGLKSAHSIINVMRSHAKDWIMHGKGNFTLADYRMEYLCKAVEDFDYALRESARTANPPAASTWAGVAGQGGGL